jgi:hypothetical protein
VARLHRFGGVFQHIGHRLAKLVAIAGDQADILVGGEGEADFGRATS